MSRMAISLDSFILVSGVAFEFGGLTWFAPRAADGFPWRSGGLAGAEGFPLRFTESSSEAFEFCRRLHHFASQPQIPP